MLYCHDKQPVIPEASLRDVPELSKCASLALCVCKGRGLQAHFFAENVRRLLRPLASVKRRRRDKVTKQFMEPPHPKPRVRQLLEAGKLVLRFQQRVPEQIDTSLPHAMNWDLFAQDILDGRSRVSSVRHDVGPPLAQSMDVWFHVGYMNYGNLLYSGVRLVYGGPSLHRDDFLILQVDSELEVVTDLELFVKHCCFEQLWDVKFYEVVVLDVDIPSENMIPNQILARQLDEAVASTLQVWKGICQEEEERELAAAEAARRRGAGEAGRSGGPSGHARPSGRPPARRALEDGEAADDDGALSDYQSDAGENFETLFEAAELAEPADPFLAEAWALLEAEYLVVETPQHGEEVAPPSVGLHMCPVQSTLGLRDLAPHFGHRRKQPQMLLCWKGMVSCMSTGAVTPLCHDGDCRRTRTLLPSKRDNVRQGQGRPLGMLAAWLLAGAGVTEKSQRQAITPVRLTRDARIEARRQLLAMEGGPEFVQCERARRPGKMRSQPFLL